VRARRRWVFVLGVLVLLAGQQACTGSSPAPPPAPGFVPAPPGPSWAPNPQRAGGLSALAQTEGDRYVLHTAHGDVDFLPGVNLGSTTPGHQPGEVDISAEDLRRWLPLMGQFGFRVLRVYTILPPAFYTELAAYNTAHENAPLFLMQGVYLPDESYVEKGNLYDPAITNSFTGEIRDAVAAVHGDLNRGTMPGRATGRWTTDVSRWLAGWIIGSELDPYAVRASDVRNADAPKFQGRYFRSGDGASPTESWLAARMDELAAAEAQRGQTVPVAFINWPTLDPLRHPDEPREGEDLVGVDANRVLATAAWPGGTFASYHAYPYYPDFQRYEPDLQIDWNGRTDPYAGYLSALRRHHAGMPVMISEFGVPSSLGTSHSAPLDRGQGNHPEAEAMAQDADMLRTIRALGLAGGLLFAWTDEWFKLSWNTAGRQLPADRRQLWHDPLTNEQYFGLVATDPVGGPPEVIADDPAATVRAATDESWVHVELRSSNDLPGLIALGFDVVGGGGPWLPGTRLPANGADYAVLIDTTRNQAQAWVRADLDPTVLDNLPGTDAPAGDVDGWRPQRLTTNGAHTIPTTGQALPAEFFDVGDLRRGEMTPGAPGYDNLATWQVAGRTVTLRLPWGLLGMADPSSKLALVPRPDHTAATVPVDHIGLTVYLGDRRIDTGGITWQSWQDVRYRERVKDGAQTYVDAVTAVTPR